MWNHYSEHKNGDSDSEFIVKISSPRHAKATTYKYCVYHCTIPGYTCNKLRALCKEYRIGTQIPSIPPHTDIAEFLNLKHSKITQ